MSPSNSVDFQNVSKTDLAQGLSNAFRSDQTPPFSQMVGSMFGQSNGQQKAGVLNQMLGSINPGMLGSLLGGGGVLSGLAGMLGGGGATPQITPEQAQQISPEAAQQIAEHAQKHDPSVVEQVSNFYSQHPTLVQGLGAGALAMIMSHVSQR